MSESRDSGLGTVLVEKGLLSEEQLEKAFKLQKRDGMRLKDAVVRLGYATGEQLIDFISENADMSYVKLTVDMIDPEAARLIPEKVAREYNVIPITVIADILTIAVSSPFDLSSLDVTTFASGYSLEPVLSDEEDITRAINHFFEESRTGDGLLAGEEDGIEYMRKHEDEKSTINISAGEKPIVRLVNILLIKAIKEGASDIHVEPRTDDVRVRYRIDGSLKVAKVLPIEVHNPLLSRIKVLCELDISERRKPQDGRFFARYRGSFVDFRVATSPTIYGESVILRILDQSKAYIRLEHLGFDPADYQRVMDALAEPHGFILVTGPTGSGKTTTLYAAINEIYSDKKKIITIEDPVEYRLENISQIPVDAKIGLTFSSILRSVLRQDPDIIMVGEIRDGETAQIAVQAALTGHMLLSTLHTTGAPETLPRLVDMGVEPFYVREVVRLIIAQRLVRKLCKRCREPYVPQEDELMETGLPPDGRYTFYHPVGCDFCGNSGYRGRSAVFEVMRINEDIKALLTMEISPLEVRKKAVEDGMRTFWQNAVSRVLSGETSVGEILGKIPR
ncbi:MAG: Flp pilus assembly complex ATPase component TadA [Actinobacteria bacterium]|nr:Flp pilus assembly complex ATPase component TadA [Actinomycetota bacterium]